MIIIIIVLLFIYNLSAYILTPKFSNVDLYFKYGEIIFLLILIILSVIYCLKSKWKYKKYDAILVFFLLGFLAREISLERSSRVKIITKRSAEQNLNGYKGMIIDVEIACATLLPSHYRILNCGWHGCIYDPSGTFRIDPIEGCDATWFRDYAVIFGFSLKKKMRLMLSEKGIKFVNEELQKIDKFQSFTPDIFGVEPSNEIYEDPVAAQWTSFNGKSSIIIDRQWLIDQVKAEN